MAHSSQMKIMISTDSGGDLHAVPVSKDESRYLHARYGTDAAYAQEGTQLSHGITDTLTRSAQKSLNDGYDATVIVDRTWCENWVAYHNGV